MSDTTTTQHRTDEPIFKKWHRSGFISVGYWAAAGKVTVEIGATNADKSLISATKCYIPATQFLAYLHAEINKNVTWIFPDYAQKGIVHYGGGLDKNKTVEARVMRVQLAKSREGAPDLAARIFTCSSFDGKKTGSGAIEPITSAKRTENFMKIPMAYIAELYEVLNIAMLTGALSNKLSVDDTDASE